MGQGVAASSCITRHTEEDLNLTKGNMTVKLSIGDIATKSFVGNIAMKIFVGGIAVKRRVREMTLKSIVGNTATMSLVGGMMMLPIIVCRRGRAFLSLCVIRSGFIDISEI